MKGERERRRKKGEKRGGWRGVWDEKGRKQLRSGRGVGIGTGGRDLEAGRKEVEKRIKEVLEEVEKKMVEGGGRKRGTVG